MENLNNESTIFINSLSNYEIGYHSDALNKDITVPAFAKEFEVTIAEVIEQVKKNNVAYTGLDGVGSHALFVIIDDEAREFIFGTAEKPIQFTKETIEKMLQHQTREEFKAALAETIVTKNEAQLMLHSMKYVYKELEEYGWKTKMLKDHCEWIVVKREGK